MGTTTISETLKKQRVQLAREIRKSTGIPLPASMLIAKVYLRGGIEGLYQAQLDGWTGQSGSEVWRQLADLVAVTWNKSTIARDLDSVAVRGPRGVYPMARNESVKGKPAHGRTMKQTANSTAKAKSSPGRDERGKGRGSRPQAGGGRKFRKGGSSSEYGQAKSKRKEPIAADERRFAAARSILSEVARNTNRSLISAAEDLEEAAQELRGLARSTEGYDMSPATPHSPLYKVRYYGDVIHNTKWIDGVSAARQIAYDHRQRLRG